jgi:hypothetical protein
VVNAVAAHCSFKRVFVHIKGTQPWNSTFRLASCLFQALCNMATATYLCAGPRHRPAAQRGSDWGQQAGAKRGRKPRPGSGQRRPPAPELASEPRAARCLNRAVHRGVSLHSSAAPHTTRSFSRVATRAHSQPNTRGDRPGEPMALRTSSTVFRPGLAALLRGPASALSTTAAAAAAAAAEELDRIHLNGLVFHGYHGVYPEVRPRRDPPSGAASACTICTLHHHTQLAPAQRPVPPAPVVQPCCQLALRAGPPHPRPHPPLPRRRRTSWARSSWSTPPCTAT